MHSMTSSTMDPWTTTSDLCKFYCDEPQKVPFNRALLHHCHQKRQRGKKPRIVLSKKKGSVVAHLQSLRARLVGRKEHPQTLEGIKKLQKCQKKFYFMFLLVFLAAHP